MWPTTDNPKTKYVTLRLTEDEERDLLALAASRGMNKSSAVRWCVDRVVAAEKKQAARQKHAERG